MNLYNNSTIFLTIFLAFIGRLGTWFGPNGEGPMNAFGVVYIGMVNVIIVLSFKMLFIFSPYSFP